MSTNDESDLEGRRVAHIVEQAEEMVGALRIARRLWDSNLEDPAIRTAAISEIAKYILKQEDDRRKRYGYEG